MSLTRVGSSTFAIESGGELPYPPTEKLDGAAKDPGAFDVRLRLVQLFIQSGKPEVALPHLRAMAEAAPDDPRHWGQLAAKLKQHDLCDRAMLVWRSDLAAGLDPPGNHLHLGRMLATLGRADEALIHLRETLRLSPSPDAKALRRLARAFQWSGQADEAADLRRRADALDPPGPIPPEAPVQRGPPPLREAAPQVIPLAPGRAAAKVAVVGPDPDSPLAACIRALRPQDDIDILARAETAGQGLDRYDLAVTVPEIEFSGFHPDIRRRGARVYHSGLVMAAFAMGLPRRTVLDLFNGAVYRTLGYFDLYAREERRLLAGADAGGLDLRPLLADLKDQVFVHVPRRPTMAFHWRLARLVCERLGMETDPDAEAPADPYLSQARWPVYPEISEQLGVRGSLRFKPAISEQSPELGLEELIEQAWRVYTADPHMVHGPQTAETVRGLRQLGM